MREATAGTARASENTRTRLALEISSSAALAAFVSPGQLGRTATNTYDFASGRAVAGDDPVNGSDPSGDRSIGNGGKFTSIAVDPLLQHLTGSPVSQLEVYTPFYNQVENMTSGEDPRIITSALSTLWNGLYGNGDAWSDNRLLTSPDPDVSAACGSLNGVTSTDAFLCYTVGSLTSPLYVNSQGSVTPQLYAWYVDLLPTANGDGTSPRESSVAYMIMNMYKSLFTTGQRLLNRLESEWESGTGTPSWIQKLIGIASDASYQSGSPGCGIYV